MKGINDTFKDYKRRNSDYFINFFKSKFIEQRIETLIIYLHVTPEKTTWKNDSVTMTLEKPLTLKYIDNEVYNQLQQYSAVQKSAEEITQQMFLDSL